MIVSNLCKEQQTERNQSNWSSQTRYIYNISENIDYKLTFIINEYPPIKPLLLPCHWSNRGIADYVQ